MKNISQIPSKRWDSVSQHIYEQTQYTDKAYRKMLENENYKQYILNHGRIMKMAMEQYIEAGFDENQAFQLVKDQAEDFRVRMLE